MDEVLTRFLHEKNRSVSKLSSTLCQEQEKVIKSFGGLANMIELCLTHPNASKHIDINSEQFNSFKQIIKMNNDDMVDSYDNDQTSQAIADIIINDGTNNNGNNNLNHQKQSQVQTVTTTAEYYNGCTIVIDCYPRNCLLFKLVDNTYVAVWLHGQILSKKLVLTLICIAFIATLLGSLLIYFNHSIWKIFVICWLIRSITVTLYCMLVFSIANLTIVDLISNTFDFWFKLYNVIAFYCAIWIRDYNVGEHSEFRRNQIVFAGGVMSQVCFLSISLLLFLVDAIPASINLKRIAIFVYVVFSSISAQYTYFFTSDFEWNPFDSKYSQISFKSIILSSQINLKFLL